MKTQSSCDDASDGADERLQTSLWEWLVALVGLCLVAATVAYLLYLSVGDADAPPAVELRVHSVLADRGVYLVRISAFNQGNATAAQLTVSGELTHNRGKKLETSRTTFDYLPAKSRREGGLYFSHDPRAHHLRLRAEGYQNP